MNKNTLSKELIVEKWEGKVKIYDLTQFVDNRGMVTEVFRKDDEVTERVQQCYISETKPFVLRGPHQHPGVEWIDDGVGQCDNFITWKSKVCYELFNFETNEFFNFTTNSDKITLVQVDTPIVHGYRNLEEKTIQTMNFPTQLFKGQCKNKEPDEVRYEESCHEKKKVIVIFGATGRLGSALVDAAYNHIGFYDYEVIPIYCKIETEKEVNPLLTKVLDVTEGKEVFFINASGYTNTASKSNENMMWVNSDLPVKFAEFAKNNNWNFIQFSSDYVFQSSSKYNVKLNAYTISKQLMETNIKNSEYPAVLVRVANLFSDKENDLRNMIQKFQTKVRLKEKFVIDPRIVVSPTDVSILANFIVDSIVNETLNTDRFRSNILKAINVLPENTYSLREFITKYYDGYDNIEEKEGLLDPWFEKFNSAEAIRIPSSEQTIINTLKRTQVL